MPSEETEGDGGTGLGIGQSMVVMEQVETAGSRNCLKLMVFQTWTEVPAGSPERVQEAIVRIVQGIGAEDGPQAAFVKRAVVRDQRQ